MTFSEIKESDKTFLYSGDICDILGVSAYNLLLQARDGGLPFPVLVVGTRVKYPRHAFVSYCEQVLGLS